MLASHGLPLVHAHAATSSEKAFRPHIHVGDQGHHTAHTHGHDGVGHASSNDEPDGIPQLGPLTDHDSAAVYCTEKVTLAQSTRVATAGTDKCLAASTILKVSLEGDIGSTSLNSLLSQPAQANSADVPIYLRTLSLRI
jgi:hypothetical protein